MWMVALLTKDIALLDTKAVLFINDNQAESLKAYVFLNECMRPDGHCCLTIFECGSCLRSFAWSQAACDQNCANTKRLEHSAYAARMLFCQKLCRGHDGSLAAVLDCH